MREALRLIMKRVEIKKGYYLVFVAKPGIEKSNTELVIFEVEKLLKIAGLV
jgi:RNase P protein component